MNDPLRLDELRRLLQSGKNVAKMVSDVNNSTLQRWRSLAGAAVDLMLEDREQALRRLTDSDPKIRYVALSLLVSHWNSAKDQEFAQQCEKMAIDDTDNTVRSVALRILGQCYKNTDDARIGKLLAQVVRDELQTAECRAGAYLALFRLRGLFADWPGRNTIPPTVFRFPEHVDWAFVASFFDETRVHQSVDPLARVHSLFSKEMRSAFSCYQEGVKAHERKEYAKAIELFTQGIIFQPQAAGIYLMRGRAYFRLGQLEQAIADFTRSVELSPHSPVGYYERGQAYAQQGLRDLAEHDYRKASDLTSQLNL